MRAFLIILAALGALVISLAVAILAGWVRLSAVDPFAHVTIAPSTRPAGAGSAAADDDDDPDGAPSTTAPATEPSDASNDLSAAVDRTIVLRAQDAKVSGKFAKLTDLPGSGKKGRPISTHVVTGLKTPDDAAEWTVTVPQAGKYTITLDYSSAYGKRTGQVDGGYVLTAAGQKIAGQVTATRHPGSFELVDAGTVDLPQGEIKVALHPDDRSTNLMYLRSIRLFPTE